MQAARKRTKNGGRDERGRTRGGGREGEGDGDGEGRRKGRRRGEGYTVHIGLNTEVRIYPSHV